MDVVADLLALVAEHRVAVAADRAFHQVRQEAVEFGPGMARPGQAAAPEHRRLHAEVAAVFLNQHIRRDLGSAEQAVQGLVDAHGLRDSVSGPGMLGRQFPAGFQLDQRQVVRRVAIDLVGAGEDEYRPFRMAARRFQQVEGAVGVGGEIGHRLPRRPVVGGLGRRVDHRRDLPAVASEDGVDRRRVADIHRLMAV